MITVEPSEAKAIVIPETVSQAEPTSAVSFSSNMAVSGAAQVVLASALPATEPPQLVVAAESMNA
jgi:hypothetical protein